MSVHSTSTASAANPDKQATAAAVRNAAETAAVRRRGAIELAASLGGRSALGARLARYAAALTLPLTMMAAR